MKATMETLRRFRRLSRSEQRVVLESAAALAATWVGLRAAGFRRWEAVLDSLAPSKASSNTAAADSSMIDSARMIGRMESAAARHLFFRVNCLEQSLVLRWLLRRRGIAAELRFGARKEANSFEAHAWVEFGGTVLNDTGDTHLHFVPFDGAITSMETQIR
ncbi:MAG: lasso peptide biosynthesis B2 protein [Candidatus Acidiferrales bacterium]